MRKFNDQTFQQECTARLFGSPHPLSEVSLHAHKHGGGPAGLSFQCTSTPSRAPARGTGCQGVNMMWVYTELHSFQNLVHLLQNQYAAIHLLQY